MKETDRYESIRKRKETSTSTSNSQCSVFYPLFFFYYCYDTAYTPNVTSTCITFVTHYALHLLHITINRTPAPFVDCGSQVAGRGEGCMLNAKCDVLYAYALVHIQVSVLKRKRKSICTVRVHVS